MFESFSNVIFIAIALAIFIGRTVAQARKAQNAKSKTPPPPPPAKPRVQALHFEETPRPAKKPQAGKTPKQTPVKKPQLALQGGIASPTFVEMPSTLNTQPEAVKIPPPISAALQNRGEFVFAFNQLSSLKQAVVMAEVLAPPKGFQ
jgi:hypothetical protein